MAEVAGGEPIIVVGQQQPAQRVVISVNLRLVSAGTFDLQRHAFAPLDAAAVAPFAAGSMRVVVGAVRIELVAAIPIRVNERVSAVEMIVPDMRAFVANRNLIQVHSCEKISPIFRGLLYDFPPRRVREE